jgi:hypothetical protein
MIEAEAAALRASLATSRAFVIVSSTRFRASSGAIPVRAATSSAS